MYKWCCKVAAIYIHDIWQIGILSRVTCSYQFYTSGQLRVKGLCTRAEIFPDQTRPLMF